MKLFSLVILQFVLFFVNIECRTFYNRCLNGDGGEVFIHYVDFAGLGLSTESKGRHLIQFDFYNDDGVYGFSGPVSWDDIGADLYFLECPSGFTGSDEKNEYVDADWDLVCYTKVEINQDDYPYTELEVIYHKKNSDDECFEGFNDYELKEKESENPTDIPKESDNDSEDESEDEEKTQSSNKTHSSSKISEWQCGKGIGKCQSGYCCSKYGWCGKASAYCSIEKGCQSEFGICNKDTSNESDDENDDETNDESDDEKESKNHKKKTSKWQCGKGKGKCPSGYCCSKYGWCGKDSQYCSKKRGCQSKFGKCW